jgi:hypothetical protein
MVNKLTIQLWIQALNRLAENPPSPFKGTRIAFVEGEEDILEWNGEAWIEITQ